MPVGCKVIVYIIMPYPVGITALVIYHFVSVCHMSVVGKIRIGRIKLLAGELKIFIFMFHYKTSQILLHCPDYITSLHFVQLFIYFLSSFKELIHDIIPLLQIKSKGGMRIYEPFGFDEG